MVENLFPNGNFLEDESQKISGPDPRRTRDILFSGNRTTDALGSGISSGIRTTYPLGKCYLGIEV